MDLVQVWFIAIALLWLGFLLLEGFDFGVAALLPLLARTKADRTQILQSIGPVWDGNEVWLVTAIGATFAAFPEWYASWLSSTYLLFLLVLLALIFRAIGFEWRHARHSDAWERGWTAVITGGSVIAALGIGAALAVTTTGLALGPGGTRVGGPLAWLTLNAALGAVAILAFAAVHGALFLALKLGGPLHLAAVRTARWLVLPGALPLLAWVGVVQFQRGTIVTASLWMLAAIAALVAWLRTRKGQIGQAFAAWTMVLAASLGTIFVALWPVVLPSTQGSEFDITAQSAAVSTYTLTTLTWMAAVGLPAVIAYQSWTYWVFRHRVWPRAEDTSTYEDSATPRILGPGEL